MEVLKDNHYDEGTEEDDTQTPKKKSDSFDSPATIHSH